MATQRAKRGGFCNEARLPKGPNGRALCRRCGTEVPKGRRTFCSAACVHEWQLETNPGYCRSQVFERDHGVCALCGLDTVAWARKRLEELDQIKQKYHTRTGPGPTLSDSIFAWKENNGTPYSRTLNWNTGLWDMDHVTPVVEGGGLCGLDGYRTLCIPCHRKVTAELRARLAKRNKRQLDLPMETT